MYTGIAATPSGQNAPDALSLNPSMALMDAHARFENEKHALVRVLHDDLGGLLVGAAMDIGWITQQSTLTAPVQERLSRAMALLRSAIDLKRTLVEELQPSLLLNVGLFSALRWHVKRTCDAAGVAYLEAYPAAEIDLNPAARVTMFRLIQDGLDYLLGDGSVNRLGVIVSSDDKAVYCRITTDRLESESRHAATADTLFTTTMHYRSLSIGGHFHMIKKPPECILEIEIPVSVAG